ncbi:universal stress protein [Actinoplanes sp. KI2]|uniref:universal stress protein n=1 Tax=Actinoplanes sp. KI2 TaxID=2983315 RepID=UPI0021D60AAA|nr:universal stress protein [Actinoplanes sp. KI2]MCU7729491.1 universal stress protein [Actinoplanes sp. KI2]
MNEIGTYRVLQEPRSGGAPPAGKPDALHGILAASVRSAPAAAHAPLEATPAGSVLVGVDDSPASYAALDLAAREAELHGWELRLLHVQHPGERRTTKAADFRLLEGMTDRVHAAAPAVPVTSHLVTGSAASLLLIEGGTANLLVVGHRHHAVGTTLGLSVGDRVAAQHSGVVMVVRVPYWPPGPGIDLLPIVVGVDNHAAVTPAVTFAQTEARLRGCHLVMLHAQPNAAPAERTDTIGGVVVHHLTVDAHPAPALIDYSHRAAAVVVGRRGVGMNPVTMLGSVSRAMVQHANCPVFLAG